jgi:hypothetical protein
VLPLSADRLLSTLKTHGVEFVVIGGFSLAAHGVVRGTKDLDIMPAPASENLARLANALRDMAARPLLADDFDPVELGLEPDASGLLAGGNWVLATQYGRLDVMQLVEGVKSYEDLYGRAVMASAPGVEQPVAFAGLDDLVAMKTAAGRPQDLIDIADLERARLGGG